MKFSKLAMIVGAVAFFTSPSLKADTVTFDFNSLANGASNGSVQSYMNGVLGAGRSVVVAGSQASNSYTGMATWSARGAAALHLHSLRRTELLSI
jgi:hypothetical protein